MTNEELLVECKKGLGIPLAVTATDSAIRQKLLAVKSYIIGAGVSETILTDDLAVGCIVIGVTDLWNLNPGEIKFSPAFRALLTQLVYRS